MNLSGSFFFPVLKITEDLARRHLARLHQFSVEGFLISYCIKCFSFAFFFLFFKGKRFISFSFNSTFKEILLFYCKVDFRVFGSVENVPSWSFECLFVF